jgi:SAM-dependent methyltransferase
MNDSEKHSRAAWDAFWQQNRQADGSARGGCLPDAWQGIDRVQTRVWRDFARRLPRGARVIDIATGDGRVMARLLEARRDLKPVGIDQAEHLPPPPRGAKMRANVLMHQLPFPDAGFAAVTSQFGFEYGQMDAAAAEVARVLRPGGMVGMMTHRANSPIVQHNRRRREQIEWAISKQDLPGKALRNLQLRQLGIAPIPPEISAAPTEGAAKFGQGSAAWEIAEAIRRTLAMSRGEAPAQTAAVIGQIVAQAENELGRIASLEMAAQAAGDGEKVEAALVEAGLAPVDRQDLRDGDGTPPFASFLVLNKLQ